MVQRVRCPRCSKVFPILQRPQCPHCGLSGRVQPTATAAASVRTTPTRSASGVRRDRTVAAVAVVLLLLFAGIVTAVVLDGPDSATTPPRIDTNSTGSTSGTTASTGTNDTVPPARVDTVVDNATVGGTGPIGQEPERLLFEGLGDGATAPFATEQGLLLITLSYYGDGFFRAAFVNLDDENATRRSLSAPQGDYEGSRYLGLAPGRYSLDITTGDEAAAWQVTVEQPRMESPRSIPHQSTGQGDTASTPLELEEGEATFHVTHTAYTGEFVVRLYDANGNLVRRGDSEAVASNFGDTNDSIRISIPADGVYFVDVQATGNWSVEVTR